MQIKFIIAGERMRACAARRRDREWLVSYADRVRRSSRVKTADRPTQQKRTHTYVAIILSNSIKADSRRIDFNDRIRLLHIREWVNWEVGTLPYVLRC